MYLSRKNKWKIVFSTKEDWADSITKGFRYTLHEITFSDLTRCSFQNYDLVIPLTIRDLKYLTGIRHQIEKNPIPIPGMECITLCDDKYLFNQTISDSGFRDLIPQSDGKLEYPYILKKRIDEWGENSHIIKDARQERALSDTLLNSDYFSQEFILGRCEYATHILIKNKKVVYSINNKYVFETETPIKGKDKAAYARICRCPYIDLFSSILTYIGFDGLCCINYKVRANRPVILEINPRFGGSLSPYFFSFMRHLD